MIKGLKCLSCEDKPRWSCSTWRILQGDHIAGFRYPRMVNMKDGEGLYVSQGSDRAKGNSFQLK